ncbi:MAG: DHH family phosphoesterase [Methanomicrobiales archaeon]|nr:DHH family phosphoesterase [Methanomicrobiales archaeon]
MGFPEEVAGAADTLSLADEVTIVSHIDADGIAAEAILGQALDRAGVRNRSIFVRQLEPLAMRHVPREDGTLKVFLDLGAGQQNLLVDHGLEPGEVLILDHHVSQPAGRDYRQVNGLPHGHTRLSAAGVSYLVSRYLDPSCVDLSPLAVVGNVGDMMARTDLQLVGPARGIVEEGQQAGYIDMARDLNCYGISTRPAHVCLAFGDDPFIPGISGNPTMALSFLQHLGVTLQDPSGAWLVWEEIPFEGKRRIVSALAQQLVLHGKDASRLIGEVYLFPHEAARSPLRNAPEFATVLNACGRWAKPLVGSRICRGDRGGAYREAEHMLTHHRGIIRELLQFILDRGVTELSHLQYIHVGDRFPDTIIGIGAGMALSKLNPGKPILILGQMSDDPLVSKASLRTTDEMVRRGVDLQQVVVTASERNGGSGGGHRIAAGAFIPKGAEERFVHCANRILAQQFADPGQDHC